MKLCYLGNVVLLLIQLCHYKAANFLNLNLLLQPSNPLGLVYLINWCHKKVFARERYFIFHSYGNQSEEQLNTCWYFISLVQCEVENRLTWVTKIEPKPMMEVSLVLFVRQLHNRQNHLFCDFKISGFRNLEKEELIFGDNGIVNISNFSSLAEKQKHWLKEILILMVSEIKSLAATEVPFSSSMTNCSNILLRVKIKMHMMRLGDLERDGS